MRKFLAIITVAICLSSPALAAENILIKVNGMVCDFCAQSIWKVFQDYDAVDDIDVNLDTGIVTVNLKEGQDLTDEQLDKAITYAGYDLVEVTREEDTE